MLEILAREAPAYGVRLSEEQLELFAQYHAMLLEWSARVNLVGDASAETVQRRHFLESIALGAALRERELLRPDSSVLDLGAGAGFPGLPLKICWPGIRLTLIEATAKKATFLEAVVSGLGFAETPVLGGRAEDLGHDPALRDRFDLVVARAVAPVSVLVELGLPFARLGGRLATPKGSRAGLELANAANALQVLGGRAISFPLRVPGPPQTVVIVAKERESPPEYPRRTGTPGRKPL